MKHLISLWVASTLDATLPLSACSLSDVDAPHLSHDRAAVRPWFEARLERAFQALQTQGAPGIVQVVHAELVHVREFGVLRANGIAAHQDPDRSQLGHQDHHGDLLPAAEALDGR
jgi:hypothetical protein